tara:strand:+ start:22 stop:2310 length:2289 start_codon:yes stop_codon:yes gene_type:complete
MNLIKNFKIDKNKIIQLSIVVTTLFLITCFLYQKFLNGNYIFAVSDYFAPKMVSESIKNLQNMYGEYPYWLPSIFGGMPTIHSLQNISDYYMPNFFLNILKVFSAPEIWTQLIHLIFSGLGVYVLLRFLKVDFLISLFGSILFLLTPYMNVCIAHGHGSQIMTASYIPWICWGLFKLWKNVNLQNFGILAILIGFQLQRGHIQIAYYTWLMIGIFILYKILTTKFKPKFYYYLIGSLFSGFVMSISILLPSYFYSEHSIRGVVQGGAALNYATNWSFSVSEMITFILPSFYGFGGSTYWGTIEPAMTDFPNYLGIFTIVFLVYGIIKNTKINNYIYFMILSIFFLLLSFGKNFFLFELLFSYLPFFNKFRVPMMALMMFQFSIIILSALGFQYCINTTNDKINLKYLFGILGALLIFFITFKFIIIDVININENVLLQVKTMLHNDLNRSIIILLCIMTLIVYSLYNTIKYNIIIIIIIILTSVDMYMINHKIITNPFIQIEEVLLQKMIKPLDNLKHIIKKDNDNELYRIISFTGYNQIKNWAAYASLEDITGYHPAKLKNYAQFEPYLNTNIGRNLFRLLNVKKLVNWKDSNWEILSTKENLNPLNRIFFIDSLIQYKKDEELLLAMNSDQFDPTKLSYTKSSVPQFIKSNFHSFAKIKKWTPNKIIIETNLDNQNFIGLSEIYYPNWEIVNHDIEIIQINGLLRGFVAPKGKNTIIMQFNYNDVKYSSLISIIAFLIMLSFTLSTYLFTFLNEKSKKSS